jgi:hypothetical protein
VIGYLVGVVLLAAACVARAVRPLGPGQADRWLRARGLEVDADSRAVVTRHLRRGRRWRAAGFLAPFASGLTAGAVWALLAGHAAPQPWATLADPRAWVAGYLLGAVLAELSWPRPVPAAGPRAAALRPRRQAHYLPGWVVPGCWAAAAGAVLAALAQWSLPMQQAAPQPGGAGLLLAGTAAGMAGVTQLAVWAVVRRRQPFGSARQLAVDDALRSASLRRAAGAGLMFGLLVLADRLWALAVDVQPRPLRVLLPLLAVACLAAAWNAFVRLRGQQAWRVDRAPAGPPARGGDPA